MRISDWSSDVCSSDLDLSGWRGGRGAATRGPHHLCRAEPRVQGYLCCDLPDLRAGADHRLPGAGRAVRKLEARKSVVSGKSVSVRVDLGGRRIIKKKKKNRAATYTI